MMVDLVGVPGLLGVLGLLADVPEDEDVVAGPIGFVIFIGLCIAVAVIGWSLNKHLKKAARAADEGVFGDPVRSESTGSTGSTGTAPAGPTSDREASTGEE